MPNPARETPASKDSASPLWWVAGASSLAAALLGATAGGFIIPPVIGGILWGVAWGMFTWGIRSLTTWGPPVRVGVSLGALGIAFSLWQATSPHAVLRVSKHELAEVRQAQNGLFHVGVNVFFENSGRYAAVASYSTVATSEALPIDPARVLQVEHRLIEAVSRGSSFSYSEIPAGDRLYVTVVSGPFTKSELEEFKAGRRLLFVAGIFRFTDWWFWPRKTMFCVYNDGHSSAARSTTGQAKKAGGRCQEPFRHKSATAPI
jgi:hypothetical protein